MESSRFRVLALVSEEDKPNSDGNLIPMASNLEAMASNLTRSGNQKHFFSECVLFFGTIAMVAMVALWCRMLVFTHRFAANSTITINIPSQTFHHKYSENVPIKYRDRPITGPNCWTRHSSGHPGHSPPSAPGSRSPDTRFMLNASPVQCFNVSSRLSTVSNGAAKTCNWWMKTTDC